jgi:hypothetical protein
VGGLKGRKAVTHYIKRENPCSDLQALLEDLVSDKPLDLVKHLRCTQEEADKIHALAERVASQQQQQQAQHPMTEEEAVAWAKRVAHLITDARNPPWGERVSTVICPVCATLGLSSEVFDEGTMKHLISFSPYYDSDGVQHLHDPNQHASLYHCSEEHRFERVYYKPCPSCGYVSAPEKLVVIEPPCGVGTVKK